MWWIFLLFTDKQFPLTLTQGITLPPTPKVTCTHGTCSVQWIWGKNDACYFWVKTCKVPSLLYSDYWLSRWWSLDWPGPLTRRPRIMGNWHAIWEWEKHLFYFCHWGLENFCFHWLNQATRRSMLTSRLLPQIILGFMFFLSTPILLYALHMWMFMLCYHRPIIF